MKIQQLNSSKSQLRRDDIRSSSSKGALSQILTEAARESLDKKKKNLDSLLKCYNFYPIGSIGIVCVFTYIFHKINHSCR